MMHCIPGLLDYLSTGNPIFVKPEKPTYFVLCGSEGKRYIYIFFLGGGGFFKETLLKNYLVFCCCIVSHIGFPVMEIVDKAWKVTAHVTTSSVEIGKICWVRFVVCCSV